MSRRGQSSVEAAVLLPALMLLLALLVQPVCVFYTRTVMAGAAAEAARVAVTEKDDEVIRSYALRRLAAVPESSVFHVGGTADWDVRALRSSDGHDVEVEIAGHLRPLPLFGVATWLMGERDETGLLVRVHLEERLRPGWLGGEYGDWIGAWK